MSSKQAALICAVICLIGTSVTVFAMVSKGVNLATVSALIPDAAFLMAAIGFYRHAGRT
jgi:hypothetical protein